MSAVFKFEAHQYNMQGIYLKSFVLLYIWTFHSTFSQLQNGASNFDDVIDELTAAVGADVAITPSPPPPSHINCYVEIPATRVGGKCVRLGRGRRRFGPRRRRQRATWGCQAGLHLDIGSPDCPRRNRWRRPRRNEG